MLSTVVLSEKVSLWRPSQGLYWRRMQCSDLPGASFASSFDIAFSSKPSQARLYWRRMQYHSLSILAVVPRQAMHKRIFTSPRNISFRGPSTSRQTHTTYSLHKAITHRIDSAARRSQTNLLRGAPTAKQLYICATVEAAGSLMRFRFTQVDPAPDERRVPPYRYSCPLEPCGRSRC